MTLAGSGYRDVNSSESRDLQAVSWEGGKGVPPVCPPSVLQLDVDVWPVTWTPGKDATPAAEQSADRCPGPPPRAQRACALHPDSEAKKVHSFQPQYPANLHWQGDVSLLRMDWKGHLSPKESISWLQAKPAHLLGQGHAWWGGGRGHGALADCCAEVGRWWTGGKLKVSGPLSRLREWAEGFQQWKARGSAHGKDGQGPRGQDRDLRIPGTAGHTGCERRQCICKLGWKGKDKRRWTSVDVMCDLDRTSVLGSGTQCLTRNVQGQQCRKAFTEHTADVCRAKTGGLAMMESSLRVGKGQFKGAESSEFGHRVNNSLWERWRLSITSTTIPSPPMTGEIATENQD